MMHTLVKVIVGISSLIIFFILLQQKVQTLNQFFYTFTGNRTDRKYIAAAGKLQVSSPLIQFTIRTVNFCEDTDNRLLKLGGQSSGKPTIITAGILDQTNNIRIVGSDGQRAPIPSLLHIFTGCIDKITHVLYGLGLIVFNLFMDQPLDQSGFTCSGRSDQHNTHVLNSGPNHVFVMETASKPSLL